LPKGIEKVDHAWLQMVSKVGVYVDNLVEHLREIVDVINKEINPKAILSCI
jgi:hypothetical protein